MLQRLVDGVPIADTTRQIAARCMAKAGLQHFDAHLSNIVIDGGQLYLTDFGLTTSFAFSLSNQEADFLRAMRSTTSPTS